MAMGQSDVLESYKRKNRLPVAPSSSICEAEFLNETEAFNSSSSINVTVAETLLPNAKPVAGFYSLRTMDWLPE